MFITFEGIEGVGKTTHLKWIAQQLQRAGISVLTTREPGGTPIGEEIRDILLAHRHERVAPLTELLLMFAARAQHVDTVIRPALELGHWVLCDRFVDATYAYQGGGRGVETDLIAKLEKLVLGNFKPDLTLLFDAPIALGLSRIKERGGVQDRFEQEKLDFFERVRLAYKTRAEQDPLRHKIIDASKTIDEVQAELLAMITTFYNFSHSGRALE
ncbi:MAG TPA: dTMP kinase [Gammaproteobacteria bacterium]|nr:dTMP kinase [Gammaproteobacteria bacterium]HQZ87611.1 dTMP kinase [Gammaproteobacteria bacterium]HRA43225.1 dTMP kinase [Gammaproteobacteria bacterium]